MSCLCARWRGPGEGDLSTVALAAKWLVSKHARSKSRWRSDRPTTVLSLKHTPSYRTTTLLHPRAAFLHLRRRHLLLALLLFFFCCWCAFVVVVVAVFISSCEATVIGAGAMLMSCSRVVDAFVGAKAHLEVSRPGENEKCPLLWHCEKRSLLWYCHQRAAHFRSSSWTCLGNALSREGPLPP